MRFIWNHNLSVIAISGAAAVMLSATLVWRGCKASPESYFPRKTSEFLAEKKLISRISELDAELDKNPENVHLLFKKAIFNFQRGEEHYPDAIVALEKSRHAGLLDARIFYYLGFMYQHKGLSNYAETEYRRFLFNFPDDYDASMLLGKSLYSQKKYDEAASLYLRLLTKNKKDKILLTNAAFALWKSGKDYKNILNRLKKTGKEGHYLALTSEGEMFIEEKKYSEAAEIIAQAEQKFKFAEHDANLHMLKAKLAIYTNNIEETKSMITYIEGHFPGNQDIPFLKKQLLSLEKAKAKAANTQKRKTKNLTSAAKKTKR